MSLVKLMPMYGSEFAIDYQSSGTHPDHPIEHALALKCGLYVTDDGTNGYDISWDTQQVITFTHYVAWNRASHNCSGADRWYKINDGDPWTFLSGGFPQIIQSGLITSYVGGYIFGRYFRLGIYGATLPAKLACVGMALEYELSVNYELQNVVTTRYPGRLVFDADGGMHKHAKYRNPARLLEYTWRVLGDSDVNKFKNAFDLCQGERFPLIVIDAEGNGYLCRWADQFAVRQLAASYFEVICRFAELPAPSFTHAI